MLVQNSTTEIWKPVIGFENYYHVSNLGNVKRVCSKRGTKTGRMLTLSVSPGGYYYSVRLSVNNKKKNVYVHHLVMEAFSGPRPSGYWINHINGIKTDNRWPQNLEYITPKQNQQHASKLGLLSCGENRWSSRLTEKQVLEILSSREHKSALSKKYGITEAYVTNIRLGKAWKHISREERSEETKQTSRSSKMPFPESTMFP